MRPANDRTGIAARLTAARISPMVMLMAGAVVYKTVGGIGAF
jgi:hypothetical protein